MTIWTTFCPSKVCWELTYTETEGRKPTSNWLDHQSLLQDCLKLLKNHGISGIRLVIFPSEVTKDGKIFDWVAIETMLTLCQKEKMLVDLCLGPFQYPYYPGIYLPKNLLEYVDDNENALDTNPVMRKFGVSFLKFQLERYSDDKRIYGFHLANEWPDKQTVAEKEKLKKTISDDFMVGAASIIKNATTKPIRINTNVPASDKRKLTNTFTNILTILKEQGYIGFDIYPSQITWTKAFFQKLRETIIPYRYYFNQMKKTWRGSSVYFAEIEAQPWGNGRAWYTIIKSELQPEKQVLSYTKKSLDKTWRKYIVGSDSQIVSLWGSDFWLVSNKMGLTWPMDVIKTISSQVS